MVILLNLECCSWSFTCKLNVSEAHSEPCVTSTMELFAKIVNGYKLLITLEKSSIVYTWQGPEYDSALLERRIAIELQLFIRISKFPFEADCS